MTDTSATDPDTASQLALQDFRLRVANREPIRPEEYHVLILSLQRGREFRAARALAEGKAGAKAKAAANKAAGTKPGAKMDDDALGSLFAGLK